MHTAVWIHGHRSVGRSTVVRDSHAVLVVYWIRFPDRDLVNPTRLQKGPLDVHVDRSAGHDFIDRRKELMSFVPLRRYSSARVNTGHEGHTAMLHAQGAFRIHLHKILFWGGGFYLHTES